MRTIYQAPKSQAVAANLCEGCLEKQREIDRLKEEVARLRIQLSQKKRKDRAGYFGSSTPSAQQPVKANSAVGERRKQGGAILGHAGNGRSRHQRAEADEIHQLKTDESQCPQCKIGLWHRGYRERSVLEMEPIKVKRVIYQLERKSCPQCARYFQAQAPGVLPHSLLSNNLMIEIAESHYLQGIPLARVTERLGLNYGTVVTALHRLATIFKQSLMQLKADYRSSIVRHADETRWRTDGQNGYCWLFTSDLVSLYLYRATRSAKVVQEVFGKEALRGYLVVDRYQAYSRVPCRVQYCFAHLLRDMKDTQAEFADEPEVENFTSKMIEKVAEAMHLTANKTVEDEQYYREAQELKRQILVACQEGSQHLAVKRWQDFFVEAEEKLYHWVEDRRVPCENNRAERELRPTVIARKVSFGSQAEEGAKTREVLMSVLHTLKKRVKSPRQRLKEVLDKLSREPELEASTLLFAADSG
jgi:transposase